MSRTIIRDGKHTQEVLSILSATIDAPESLLTITEKAAKILEYSVDPISGPDEQTYGLLYGLIQSGKTSIITVAAGMAADNGFDCIIILTSDINPLYGQTHQRIKSHLRGLPVLGKKEWDDEVRFEQEIRTAPFAIVCSKNSGHLRNLLEAFKRAGSKGAHGLSTLIIDDEADQASLNTQARKNSKTGGDEVSTINSLITDMREFFRLNTYLQVTATPQALFLQNEDGYYRPSFTVLSEPGHGYVGGEQFFEPDSKLLRYVDLEEVEELSSGYQPKPNQKIPTGLKKALLSFLVGATAKNLQDTASQYAFLCHISYTKVDHRHLVNLIRSFIEGTVNAFSDKNSKKFALLQADLHAAYEDIKQTDPGIGSFNDIIERIEFLIKGTNIKEINSDSDEVMSLEHVYSILVGGNKLGRGVTIQNLITSYYGRNPKRPNSDTVLQHARMYGYRQKTVGVTRLFLPEKLADHYRIIHQMEKALRELVEEHPEGKFEGIYLQSPVSATRSNVLDPNSIGLYVGGRYYNPMYPFRDQSETPNTDWLDAKLKQYDDSVKFYRTNIDELIELIKRTSYDPDFGAELWNVKVISAALQKLKSLHGNSAYIRVRRDRGLTTARRETQGFLDSNEAPEVPTDAPTLFIYRLSARTGVEVWWPLIRFPAGNYALAFSFDR